MILTKQETHAAVNKAALLCLSRAHLCMCSSRQMRRRILFADLLAWLLIIFAAYVAWTLA